MGTVYVVQSPTMWNAKKQAYMPKFNFGPAVMYGDVEELLSPTAAPFNNDGIIEELHEKLNHYDHTQDYILCVGNPCLIGMAVAKAASQDESGSVAMLQWSGKDKAYVEVIAHNVVVAA